MTPLTPIAVPPHVTPAESQKIPPLKNDKSCVLFRKGLSLKAQGILALEQKGTAA